MELFCCNIDKIRGKILTVVEKKYESFMDFIDDLYRDDGKYNFVKDGDYIFRGEGKDGYTLLPKALRLDAQGNRLISDYIPSATITDTPDQGFWQASAECQIL